MNNKIKKFKKSFAEILDIDLESLNHKTKLDGSNLDSLNMLSTAALVSDLFQIEISLDEICKCDTYNKLVNLIKSKAS